MYFSGPRSPGETRTLSNRAKYRLSGVHVCVCLCVALCSVTDGCVLVT